MGKSGWCGFRIDGIAERGDDASGEACGGFDGDLLAEDGADGDFEAVPASGEAEAAASGDKGGKGRVGGQGRDDGAGVGAEVEHAAEAGDNRREGLEIGEADDDSKRGVL